jgi:hypothetical protein
MTDQITTPLTNNTQQLNNQILYTSTEAMIHSDNNATISSRTTSSNSSSSSSSSSSSESACSLVNYTKSSNNNNNNNNSNKNVFILNAFVNGFVQLKLCAEKIDYEYIIEIYWSNETRSFVKRTFEDFVRFHKKIVKLFSDLFGNSEKQSRLNQTITNDSNYKKSRFFNFSVKNGDLNSMPILPSK